MYEEVGDLNPYALDYPVCLEDSSTNAGRARKYGRGQRTWLLNHMLPMLFNSLRAENGEKPLSVESEARLKAIRQSISLSYTEEFEPCAGDYMTEYLNQDSVKAALHVKSDIVWKDCSTKLRYLAHESSNVSFNQCLPYRYATSDRHNDMTPIYNYLIDGKFGLNILVVSGTA